MLNEKVDYVKECQILEKRVAVLERDLQYNNRVIEVLIAVGHISLDKVEQAREIVSTFSS